MSEFTQRSTLHAGLGVTVAMLAVSTCVAEHKHHRHPHGYTAQQSGDACTQESHLGTGANTVDEQPVAYDVHHVATQQHPHGQLGILDAVGELLEGIEQHLWQNTQREHQQIGSHERDKMCGQSHTVHKQKKHSHNCHQRARHQGVGNKAVFQFAAYKVAVALSQQSAHYRSESVGEPHSRYEHHAHDVVYEARCSQFVCAVVTYHQSISKTHYDSAQLAYHNGYAQL